MKLRAKITRHQEANGCRYIRLTYPAGAYPFMWESILERNLGPRPYGEAFFVNKNGEPVRILWSTR